MYILGLNAYHGDAAACLLHDGVVVAACEEERFTRTKHWAGLPLRAVDFCLREAGIGLEAVDYIAISRNPGAKFWQKLAFIAQAPGTLGSVLSRYRNAREVTDMRLSLAEHYQMPLKHLKAKPYFAEHHRAHMASAFWASPYEEAALLSIDGMGDFTSTMMGQGRGSHIQVLDSISYPHSIGLLYTAFTQYLGFPKYGDEYKLMGLAAYGKPIYTKEVGQLLRLKPKGRFELARPYFKHFGKGAKMEWNDCAPNVAPLYNEVWEKLFGPARQVQQPLNQTHKDLAASVQAVTETAIFHIAEQLQQRTRHDVLCLAGGVAQNSVCNGKIADNTGFRHVFVPPAAHDAGTAIGAALHCWHQHLGQPHRKPQHYSPYLGPAHTEEDIAQYLQGQNVNAETYDDEQALIESVVDCLLEGGIVGWFQGRAEWGPRALGNRSILADPSHPQARELINSKIKRRESFRPFAPSVLAEKVAMFFEKNEAVPFMEKVHRLRPEWRDKLPAITHVDGTGRLQSVSPDNNPLYYRLIQHFGERSGIPMLLNTSFNENEPIVNSPAEAHACFERTEMDMLVLGRHVLRRQTDQKEARARNIHLARANTTQRIENS